MTQTADLIISDQQPISLGDLIDLLAERPADQSVMFDFGYCGPTSLDSYRGYYDHLAIGYADEQHGVSVGAFLEQLRGAVGEVYTGWKGGDFRMTRNTPMWVANSGNSGGSCVIGIYAGAYQTVIATGYCENWAGGMERARKVVFEGLGFGNTHR